MAMTATATSAARSTRSRRLVSRSSSVRYGVRLGGGMSRRCRTRVLRTRKASQPMTATATIARVAAPMPISGSLLPRLDARRPLGIHRGLVRSPRGLDHLAGVDDELAGVVKGDDEAIEVARRRTVLALAVVVVLGRVAGAFET